MKFIIFICVFTSSLLASQKEEPKAKAESIYPLVIDSLLEANLPYSYQAKVTESDSKSSTLYFDFFYWKKEKQFGLRYQSSGVTPNKHIWYFKKSKETWTLDSAGGRIRKIANHKKLESVNGSQVNYWLVYPYFLLHKDYHLIRDTLLSAETRQVFVKTKMPFPYYKVYFEFHPQTLLLQKIDLHTYNRSLTKSLIFHRKLVKEKSVLSHITLINYRDGSKAKFTFSDQQKITQLPPGFFPLPK